MRIYTRYDRPAVAGLRCPPDSSLTRQEFAAEADINTLVARYQETGSYYDPITDLKGAARKPMFGDYTAVPDYQTALGIVIDAQDRFASLPSAVRDRFDNDPAALLAWIDKPENFDEAVKLGLLPPPEEKPPEEKPPEEKPPEAAK